MRQLFLFLIVSAFSIAFQAHMAFAARLDMIRFGKQQDATRIVLDLTGPVDYRLDTLNAPPRLVIDLPAGTEFSGRQEHDGSDMVSGIRYGHPTAHISRIVLDLNAPIGIIRHFLLPPGTSSRQYRLVIDIAKTAPRIPAVQNSAATADAADYAIAKPTPKPSTLTLRKKYVVVIDAGHGGADPGAIGTGKVREKDVVLAISKSLKEQLESTGRYVVHMTRKSDYYIKLRERFQRARDMRADLFISIHADKIHIPSVHGASVYTLSETASDKETARLARQENNAGIVAGVDLAIEEDEVANILLDLVRRETLNESKLFAELIVDSMEAHNIHHLSNPHRYAGFAVLKAPDVPSVLIEAGFLSNAKNSRLLRKPDYQHRFAVTIQAAIDKFFDRLERLNGL